MKIQRMFSESNKRKKQIALLIHRNQIDRDVLEAARHNQLLLDQMNLQNHLNTIHLQQSMFSKIRPEIVHGRDKEGNYTITTWTDPETGEKKVEKNYIQKVDKKYREIEK